MKQTKKPCFAMRAACVLLCLVLISVHFVTGLYARYITKATGADSGRLSSFRVSAVMTGDQGSYDLAFTNSSETAVRYSVTVQTTPGMFASIELNSVSTSPDADGLVSFSNLGTLAAGGNGSATLKLTPDPTYSGNSSGDSPLDFSNDSTSSVENELPFTVTVSYLQVD